MQPIQESELIINPDGSIYHLNLLPTDIAPTIILVGDPERVSKVSKHFDSIDLKKAKREFVTHTGYLNKKRITVLSTGIGTDNIDIVLTELDALVNIDFKTRTLKDTLTSLDIIRIGTSGSLQKHIPTDSILLSSFGLGMEGLLHFYEEQNNSLEKNMIEEFKLNYSEIYKKLPIKPTISQASNQLIKQFTQSHIFKGITITCSGFYAPQGRIVRLKPSYNTFLDDLTNIELQQNIITNFEMETSAIYGLSNLLGHNAISINCIIANRATGEFSIDPKKAVENTITWALNIISN